MNEEDYRLKRHQELVALHVDIVKECLEAYMSSTGTFDKFKSMTLYLDFIRGLDPIDDSDLVDLVYMRHYSELEEGSDEGS